MFGGERFGADGTHKRLFSGVYALVSQQSVLLGKSLPTNQAPKRLLSWGKIKTVSRYDITCRGAILISVDRQAFQLGHFFSFPNRVKHL